MNRALPIGLALAIYFVAGIDSFSGQPRIAIDELRIKHEVITLDNGLRLIVHEDHSVPIVAVNSWYHVGSKNEKRGRTGFAHLFEHFFFNGSKNYPHGFREAMDDIGANNRNGTTDVDRTNFFEDVPISALERTLYLEADRLGFLSGNLSQEMLERERGVVQNEKRQGENRPYGRVFTRICEAMYPASHPYSWPTIGSMEDLNAASLDDIREWNDTWYRPNNVVLSLAGDITRERAVELVTKYFGAIPPGPPVVQLAQWVPTLDHHLRELMQDRVPQPRVYRVWHAPAWRDEQALHLALFASVLSGSKSAPLDRALVYGKELATDVTAMTRENELASQFMVVVSVKPGLDVHSAEREMDAVLARLLETGPTADELQRAQTRILAGFAKGMERLGGFGGRSDILAESLTFGGSTEAYVERLNALVAATPEQVRDSARRWLRAPHYTMVVLPYPAFKAAKSDLDRSVVPALAEAPDVKFPTVQRAKLDNGLEVLLLERHSAPLVNLTLAIDAGYASDPHGHEGLASLAMDMLDEGTRTRDAFQIVDELDSLGATLSTGNSLDLSFISLRALKMNLAPALEVYADVALHPAFPKDMVAIQKKRSLAAIAQEKATPNALVARVLPRLIFPTDHAYAKPFTGHGYENTVSTLSQDELVRWHERWFRASSAKLIVTGAITLDELMPLLRKSFEPWPAGPAPAKNIERVQTGASRATVYLIDRPNAPQSVIAAAHLSHPGGDPRDLAMEIVMRNFGGMATSRLNRNLRLDKHWSYGSSARLLDARGQRPLIVVAPVQTDKTKEAMVEVAKEIRAIAGEKPIAGDEFQSITRNMTLRLPGRFETLASLEQAAIDLVNYSLPTSYFSDYARNVRALSEENLAQAAKAFVKPQEVVWLVVGDLAKVEAGIRSLAFGEVVHLDVDGNVIDN